MRKYLRTFPTYSDYLSADGQKPDLAYIEDSGRTVINGSQVFYNVDGAKAGDILLEYNGTRKCFCSLGDWKIEMALTGGYKPIGVVAIPSWKTPDNTVRVMSLVNMSTSSPTTGTSAQELTSTLNPLWGYTNSMSDVTYYSGTGIYPVIEVTSLNKVNPASNNQSIGGFAPSDCLNPEVSKSIGGTFNSSNPIQDPWPVEDDPEPCYWSNRSYSYVYHSLYEYYTGQFHDARKMIADPYVMLEYFSGNPNFATSNLDGKGETSKIMAYSTTTTITNDATTGHYPAAECCNSFKTTTTAKGDWYLPTIGELVIMYARAGKINNTLRVLQETPNIAAVQIGTPDVYQEYNTPDASATYGRRLLSSTQYGSSHYHMLDTVTGEISTYYKATAYQYSSERTRAFLAVS